MAEDESKEREALRRQFEADQEEARLAERKEMERELATARDLRMADEVKGPIVKRTGIDPNDFDAIYRYFEDHLTQEVISIGVPAEQALEWRKRLIALTDRYGVEGAGPTDNGKALIQRGDDVGERYFSPSLQVWYPGKDEVIDPPVHVSLGDFTDNSYLEGRPSNFSIKEDGTIVSLVNVYDDIPDSQKYLTSLKKMTSEEWEAFIEEFIGFVEQQSTSQ